MNLKICSKCGKEFPQSREYFFSQKRNSDGLRPNCKLCHVSFKNCGPSRGLFSPNERRIRTGMSRKRYYLRNKPKLYAQERAYRSQNITAKIKANCRTRMYLALKNGFYKQNRTFDLIGCTPDALKKHLESKFTYGMSWENYGQWHIDHILPCSGFDLSDPTQQQECFHYSNLQPLWKRDNLTKGVS